MEKNLSTLVGIIPNGSSFKEEEFNSKVEKDEAFKDYSLNKEEDGRYLLKKDDKSTAYEIFFIQERYELNLKFAIVGLTNEEKVKYTESEGYVLIKANFKEDKSYDFLNQVKLLVYATPDLVILSDQSAFRMFSGDWARDVTNNNIPPALSSMYFIHLVFDEKDQEDPETWIHTHGLNRFGLQDIEIINIKRSQAQGYYQFFKNFIEMQIDGVIAQVEKEKIAVSNIINDVILINHSESLRYVGNTKLADDESRDEYHSSENLIILRENKNGDIKNITSYNEELTQDQLVYFSPKETDRMSALAKTKWGDFVEVFERYNGSEDCSFIVKLGYESDEDNTNKEHLWFDVKTVVGEEIEAELLNEPFNISGMQKGEVKKHKVSRLSDWLISINQTNFRPDNIYELVRLIKQQEKQ